MNNYKEDVASKGNPGNSITVRRDLYKIQPELDGAIDAKVTNVNNGLSLSFDLMQFVVLTYYRKWITAFHVES